MSPEDDRRWLQVHMNPNWRDDFRKFVQKYGFKDREIETMITQLETSWKIWMHDYDLTGFWIRPSKDKDGAWHFDFKPMEKHSFTTVPIAFYDM